MTVICYSLRATQEFEELQHQSKSSVNIANDNNNVEMEACPHLREPSPSALEVIRDPVNWSCSVCSSTDGVWCCLTCGNVGCGRRAHLPALGGGHARHHFQTAAPLLESPTNKKPKQEEDPSDEQQQPPKHEVCIDVVSKAVHCYVCDDYVLSDSPWLAELRSELETLETAAASQSDESDTDMKVSDEENEQKNNQKGSTWSSSHIALGRTGLQNLGNTCYMNSVLQLLSHCSGFRSFFRDFLRAAAPVRLGSKAMIFRETTVRLKKALQQDGDSTKSPPDRLALTEALHGLLRVLWSGQWSSVAPRAFVQAVWTHGGLFAARRQQDAQEFLGFVLDRLDDEINPTSRHHPLSPILKDLFGVNQCQEVKCDGCSTVTKKIEPLLGLVLSLPDETKDETVEITENDNNDDSTGSVPLPSSSPASSSLAATATTTTTNSVTLQSCLDTLQSKERMEDANQFFCDTCDKKCNATKTVILHHSPQALLLSFRRTRWSPKRGLHKDSRKVEFPLTLDATRILNASPKECCVYKLSAIVSHSGSSPLCGHYIAWCRVVSPPPAGTLNGMHTNNSNGACGSPILRNNNIDEEEQDQWYLFNDAKVSVAKEDEVLRAEAFILLYERQQSQRDKK